MAETPLRLDIHGVRVRLDGHGPTLRELGRDFAAFRAEGASDAPEGMRLAVAAAAPPPAGRSLLRWRWKGLTVSDSPGTRRVDYPEGAALIYDYRRGAGSLWSADPDLLRELAYLAVHSRAGALLDRRGLHRVHALGFSWGGRAGLVLAPSGGGKSELAWALARRPGFRILSDDIPLVSSRDGLVRALPFSIGFKAPPAGVPSGEVRVFRRRRFGEKFLAGHERMAAAREAAPLKWVIIARRGPRASVDPCSRPRAAAALAAGLVLGLGTPQVLELAAPPAPYLAGTFSLARDAAARAAALLRALAARPAFLSAGPDFEENAAALAAFVEGGRHG